MQDITKNSFHTISELAGRDLSYDLAEYGKPLGFDIALALDLLENMYLAENDDVSLKFDTMYFDYWQSFGIKILPF